MAWSNCKIIVNYCSIYSRFIVYSTSKKIVDGDNG